MTGKNMARRAFSVNLTLNIIPDGNGKVSEISITSIDGISGMELGLFCDLLSCFGRMTPGKPVMLRSKEYNLTTKITYP